MAKTKSKSSSSNGCLWGFGCLGAVIVLSCPVLIVVGSIIASFSELKTANDFEEPMEFNQNAERPVEAPVEGDKKERVLKPVLVVVITTTNRIRNGTEVYQRTDEEVIKVADSEEMTVGRMIANYITSQLDDPSFAGLVTITFKIDAKKKLTVVFKEFGDDTRFITMAELRDKK